MLMLLAMMASTAYADNETDQMDIYKSSRFAIGIGAAIVKLDRKL